MQIVFIQFMPDDPKRDGFPGDGLMTERLKRWANMDTRQFEKNFTNLYLVPKYEEDMPSVDAAPYASNLLDLLHGRKVVFVGSSVASAFGMNRHEYNLYRFYDYMDQHMLYAVLPDRDERSMSDQEIAIARDFLRYCSVMTTQREMV